MERLIEILLIEYERVGYSDEQPQGYYVIGRFQGGLKVNLIELQSGMFCCIGKMLARKTTFEFKMEVIKMRMLRWMCYNTMMDRIRN